MTIFSVAAGAIAPGIALLSYVYLKDRYEAEPIALVARLFLYGFLAVFPVMVLQHGLAYLPGASEYPLFFAFVTSAGLEEAAKWMIVAAAVFRHAEFDEPYDGIVYAASVSLGFATMENLFYAFSEPYSISTLLLRALLPVSGHALFGIIMGYYFGTAKFSKTERSKYFAFSLLFPIFYHGLYDFLLTTSKGAWMWLMVPFMAFLWARGLWKIRHANHRSPLRIIRREEEFKI